MAATGRHCWRPAHLHVRVSGDEYSELMTKIFDSSDKRIDEDATFGVRDSLAIPCDRRPTEEELDRHNSIKLPFSMVDFDFALQPLVTDQ